MNDDERLRNFAHRFLDGEWVRLINPTVVLTVILAAAWFIVLSAALIFHKLPWYFYLPLGLIQIPIVFLFFTPLHEGVHFLISKKKWLNELGLWVCWPVFLISPFFFRKIHYTHHARTNRNDQDPDHFTSASSLPLRFFKSFFLIFYYHFFALKKFRSLRSLGHFVGSFFVPVFLINLAIVSPFTWPIFIVWIMPAFIASGLLAFFNTALPHHPGEESSRFKNTRILLVPWALQALLLNQNLHLVHHLRPSLPWYDYPDYWRQHETEIRARGAEVLQMTRRSEPYALVPSTFYKVLFKARDTLEIYIEDHFRF